jgi:hypothetical protein
MRMAWHSFALSLVLLGSAPSLTSAKPPEASPTCGQRGRVTFDKDSVLSDANGRKLARFSGGESAVTLLGPPTGGSDQAHIETGTGRGSFRIDGYVKATELRTYTAQTVPIVSGHLWLAAGSRVALASASAGKVRLDKHVSTPFDQRFSAVTECGAVTFSPPATPSFVVPGDARVYLMKVAELELYDRVPPTGAPFATLRRSSSVDSVRFFGREPRGGFIRIQYQGEVSIDAWARASELSALPRGESADVPASSYTLSSPPELALAQPPRVLKTTREVALRIAPRTAEPPIGVIEPEAEVYVMDTVPSWAKVLPKSLHILPVDELSFWVKSADLGL